MRHSVPLAPRIARGRPACAPPHSDRTLPGHGRALAALASAIGLFGCGGGESMESAGAVFDSLPDGTPIVRYAQLGSVETVVDLQPDLTLGSIDGEGPEVFGDVRGIDAGSDGEIFVLDAQALEVRVFGPEGDFRRTLSRQGEGPGELGATNGMVRVADTLFVYDHRKMSILGLSVDDGRELVRYPTPVRSYSYIWTGVRDDRGRHWKEATHSDAERVYPPEEGLNEGTYRSYMKVYDPSTESSDSVAMGDRTGRSWVQTFENGASYRQIPFSASTQAIVDPVGGFWRVSTEAYQIARISASGDTTLIIEATVPARPVTPADHDAIIAAAAEQGPEAARAATDMLDFAPSEHPVLRSIFIAADRLWVVRSAVGDERARADVFDRDGGFRGAVLFPPGASEYLAPRVRGRHIYVLVQDDLGVAYIVRSPLPEALAEVVAGNSTGT